MSANSVTQDIVKEMVIYDPDTGILTWNPRDIHWFDHTSNPLLNQKRWNNRFAGTQAGNLKAYPDNKFYRRIMILGKSYYEHRIIWLWVVGEWPDNQIDHINHNGMDNRWENLRLVDTLENSKNRSMYNTNTSGFNGVQKRHTQSGKVRWLVSIYVEYENIYLGVFDTLEEAIECRKKANDMYNYHDWHGAKYKVHSQLEHHKDIIVK